MSAPVVDLAAVAAELGLTADQAAAHIREAIDAGLLEVIADDGELLTLAALPGATTDDQEAG